MVLPRTAEPRSQIISRSCTEECSACANLSRRGRFRLNTADPILEREPPSSALGQQPTRSPIVCLGANWQRLAERGDGRFQVRNNIRADTAPAGRFGCYRTPSGHSLTVTQYREKWSCRPALRHPSLGVIVNAIVVTPAACRGHAPRRCCAGFHSSRRRSCRKKHSRNRTLGCRKALPRAWRIPGLRPRRSGP